jgi:hypothetical protein
MNIPNTYDTNLTKAPVVPNTYDTNLTKAPRYPLARYFRRICGGVGYTQMERMTGYASLYGAQLPPPPLVGLEHFARASNKIVCDAAVVASC